MKRLLLSIAMLLVLTSSGLIAQNPIKKNFGMADPHCYIFNDKAYLFTTRDADKESKPMISPTSINAMVFIISQQVHIMLFLKMCMAPIL